jgi:hypothetical protein
VGTSCGGGEVVGAARVAGDGREKRGEGEKIRFGIDLRL